MGRGRLLGSRFIAMLLFFLVVALASFLVWERVTTVGLTMNIERLKEEVLSVENEVKRLEIRRAELASHRRIETIARERLGLKYPEPGAVMCVTQDERCLSLAEKQDAEGKD